MTDYSVRLISPANRSLFLSLYEASPIFNRIFLPLDRSALAECVLPHAIAIARAFESRVTLLHVMETPREACWRSAIDPLNWQIRKAEANTNLHDVDLRLQAADLLTETPDLVQGRATMRCIPIVICGSPPKNCAARSSMTNRTVSRLSVSPTQRVRLFAGQDDRSPLKLSRPIIPRGHRKLAFPLAYTAFAPPTRSPECSCCRKLAILTKEQLC